MAAVRQEAIAVPPRGDKFLGPLRVDNEFVDRIVTIKGSNREGPRTVTLYLTAVGGYADTITVEGVEMQSLRRRTFYLYRGAEAYEPEVAYADKFSASVAPVTLNLLDKRYHNYIGADPEVFVEHGDGSLFPAFEFLGKKTNHAHSDYGVAAYWDGYQAEFAFNPADCMDGLVGYIHRGLRDVLVAAKVKDPTARLSVRTLFDIPTERLTTDDPKYTQFGCNPSINAYGEQLQPQSGTDVPFRSSGGHLHFSVEKGNKNPLLPRMVKELDRILGVVGVAMFQYYDHPLRRALYGRAGEYRAPKYGFEYRTLSSAWTLHPGVVQFVYEMARYIIGAVHYGDKDTPLQWWDVTEDEARRCINECNVELAQTLLERNRVGLTGLLCAMPRTSGGDMEAVKKLIDGPILCGMHTVLADPDRYSDDWDLRTDYNEALLRNRQWSVLFGHFAQTGRFD